MKKIVIFVVCLFFCLCLPIFLSCGNGQDDTAKKDSGDIFSGDEAEQTIDGEDSQSDKDIKILPELPGDLDFGGYKFKALYSSIEEAGVWGLRDIVSEEINGEIINDTVFERNKYLEDKYNFEIVGIPTTTATMSSTNIKKIILAGSDDYDVMFVRQNQTADLITSGCLVDLSELPYLDLSKPWWDQSVIGQLSVADRTFAATGDIMATNNNAFRIFLFNKDMIANFGLDDPYRMVRENKWTLDNFYNMCKDVSLDVNGDGIMDEKDRYGYLVQSGITINMFYAAGEQTVKKDDEGNLLISIGSEKSLQILQ
ncbi:MAG: extracellular solute-binding protein, partial [Oscillospiraceae bacterium]|nr:extracellular solute-binding protein [Oscillospiraceae bacterium]